MSPQRKASDPLRAYERLIQTFRELDKDISARAIQTFLIIARRNCDVTLQDLCRELDMPATTASKVVAGFTDLSSSKQPGLGLLTYTPDPMNMRTKRFGLTPKGKAFYKKLQE